MHIPRYWAQARLRHDTGLRHGATVQRWGWSDDSPADADAHARSRAQAALDALLDTLFSLRQGHEPATPIWTTWTSWISST